MDEDRTSPAPTAFHRLLALSRPAWVLFAVYVAYRSVEVFAEHYPRFEALLSRIR